MERAIEWMEFPNCVCGGCENPRKSILSTQNLWTYLILLGVSGISIFINVWNIPLEHVFVVAKNRSN